MASPAKKTKTSALPTCPYGARCYRKNPEHFKEFLHPAKASTSTDKTSKGADSKTPDANSKTSAVDDTSLPPCKYGASCYRKNLLHFAEFSHPTAVVRKASQDSGSDTDPIESDDDKKVGAYSLISGIVDYMIIQISKHRFYHFKQSHAHR